MIAGILLFVTKTNSINMIEWFILIVIYDYVSLVVMFIYVAL